MCYRAQVEMLVAAAGGKVLPLALAKEEACSSPRNSKSGPNSRPESVFILADGDCFERSSQIDGIGVPILSYMWLLECASYGQVVDYKSFRLL